MEEHVELERTVAHLQQRVEILERHWKDPLVVAQHLVELVRCSSARKPLDLTAFMPEVSATPATGEAEPPPQRRWQDGRKLLGLALLGLALPALLDAGVEMWGRLIP